MKFKDLIKPHILFLTLFGAGLSPKAPGTVGTIVSIPILMLMEHYINFRSFLYAGIIIFLTLISAIIAQYVQKKAKVHDPSWIVIDEFLGIAVCWPFIDSSSFVEIVLIFLFFRFFDIIKIWPASYFDREIKHGLGTVIDDLASAVYAISLFLLIKYFFI